MGIYGSWNVSLFHYRTHGVDVGRVLVGIQVPDAELSKRSEFLEDLGYVYHEESHNVVYKQFVLRVHPDAIRDSGSCKRMDRARVKFRTNICKSDTPSSPSHCTVATALHYSNPAPATPATPYPDGAPPSHPPATHTCAETAALPHNLAAAAAAAAFAATVGGKLSSKRESST